MQNLEPIIVITAKPDQCTRAWGDGVCRAGLSNYLPNSADLTDTDFWTTSIFDSVAAQTDVGQFSGATFHAFTKLAASATSYLVHAAKISRNPFDTSWFSIYYRLDNVSSFTISRFLKSGALAEITVDVANVVTATSNGIENATIQTISQAGEPDWYRLQYSIPSATLADITSPLSIAVVPVNTASQMIFYVYGAMESNRIDQDYLETTGEAAISTSIEPCFNTFKTCQDKPNYDRGTLSLKMIKSRAPAPDDDYYLPCLTDVNINPSELNPGGANKSVSPFGMRAAISITGKDFPHNDKFVDPYRLERDYNPLDRGTFITKWLARNPYYMHRLIEVESGYLSGGQVVDAVKRTFVMTSFDGVDSNGNFKISGKDLLTLAENTKAQAPRTSTGKLAADINTGLANFTLTPAGVGDLEYLSTGYIRIAKEVIHYNRTGDTISPITRGVRGTLDEAHDAGSAVQQCLEYDAQLPADILYDLLLNYAGIPDAYLGKTNWDIEGGAYLSRLYSTLITEPTGISALVSEMCEQMFFSVWWDERADLVKVRAVRSPADDVIYNLTDHSNIVKDSVAWKDLPDQLVTEVNTYYGQVNPTLKLDDINNYAAIETVLNPVSAGANKYGINKIKNIYSRWIPAGAAATAEDLAKKIANRFGEIPKQVTFKVAAKDSYLWLGDFVRMQNRLLVDEFGLPRLADMQIYSAAEIETGSQFKYVANEFFLAAPEDPNALEVTISVNTLNVNLRELFDQQYGLTLAGTETINFRVRAGVVIGGDTAGGGINVPDGPTRNAANDYYDGGTAALGGKPVGLIPFLQRAGIASPRTIGKNTVYPGTAHEVNWDVVERPLSVALDTGLFPAGTVINLILEPGAYIDGEGGNAGCHTYKTNSGVSSVLIPVIGGDGGHALEIRHPINIYNEGVITAGAAGGSGVCIESTATSLIMGAGAPGAGYLTNRYIDGILQTNRSVPVNANISEVGDADSTVFGSGSNVIVGGSTYLCMWKSNFLVTEARPGNGGTSDPDPTRFYDQAVARKAHATYRSETNNIYGSIIFNDVAVPGAAIKSGKNNITWLLKGDVRGAENV